MKTKLAIILLALSMASCAALGLHNDQDLANSFNSGALQVMNQLCPALTAKLVATPAAVAHPLTETPAK